MVRVLLGGISATRYYQPFVALVRFHPAGVCHLAELLIASQGGKGVTQNYESLIRVPNQFIAKEGTFVFALLLAAMSVWSAAESIEPGDPMLWP